MNLRKNSLTDLKAKSIDTQDLKAIKGGNYIAFGSPGTSKPKRPTSQAAYIGIYFGG